MRPGMRGLRGCARCGSRGCWTARGWTRSWRAVRGLARHGWRGRGRPRQDILPVTADPVHTDAHAVSNFQLAIHHAGHLLWKSNVHEGDAFPDDLFHDSIVDSVQGHKSLAFGPPCRFFRHGKPSLEGSLVAESSGKIPLEPKKSRRKNKRRNEAAHK